MKVTVWQRLDIFSRQLTPFFLTVFIIFLSAVRYDVPSLVGVMPLLSLIAIFHWGVYKPELLPPYAVFVIGIFQDALSGVPMGVFTITYILTYNVVVAQQRFFSRKSFYVVWLGFLVVSAGATFLVWAVLSFFKGAIIDPRAVIIQYVISLGCYPIVAYIFLRWQRALLQQV